MDRVDADVFDKALSAFSGRFCKNKAGSTKRKGGSSKIEEHSFSNVFGGETIEICYNPDTHLLVIGSSDRSRIENFLGFMRDDNSARGFSVDKGEIIDKFAYHKQAEKEKGVLSRAKDCVYSFIGRKNGQASSLDIHPELYHLLEDKERRLLDEYESQLMEMQEYVIRKDVMASHIGKINSYLETVADLSKERTVLEEKNIDQHDKFMDEARFWKELDYMPSC